MGQSPGRHRAFVPIYLRLYEYGECVGFYGMGLNGWVEIS